MSRGTNLIRDTKILNCISANVTFWHSPKSISILHNTTIIHNIPYRALDHIIQKIIFDTQRDQCRTHRVVPLMCRWLHGDGYSSMYHSSPNVHYKFPHFLVPPASTINKCFKQGTSFTRSCNFLLSQTVSTKLWLPQNVRKWDPWGSNTTLSILERKTWIILIPNFILIRLPHQLLK